MLQYYLFFILLGFSSAAAKHVRDFTDLRQQGSENAKQAAHLSGNRANHTTQGYRFYNKATAPYLVEALPDIPFPVGELYSGSVPIKANDTSRQLFFMFKPTTQSPVNEITIWLNGGPGCSSLTGFLQENGPWLWQPGTAPTSNAYSWANFTNMLWVDQPVGAGFSTGKVTATSEEDVARDFVSFLRNWEQLFGIRNFKIYLSGESYAGRYIPYIAAAMLDQNDTSCLDLAGTLIYDPTIGQYTRDSEQVPIYPFIEANNDILNIKASDMEYLAAVHQQCGYADYLDQYLQFPPPSLQPSTAFDIATNASCDIQIMTISTLYHRNPCFSIYNIIQQCPMLTNILQSPKAPGEMAGSKGTYFNRPDVKKAIHAPANIEWSECAAHPVFISNPKSNTSSSGPEFNNDTSADPIQHVLPRVIEATNRVLIGNGDWDFLIPTNGTLLDIQNMTWHGLQGFQTRPATPIVVDMRDLQYAAVFADEGVAGFNGPQGTMGVQHFERGLMWAETFQCGHMQPQDQPRVALRHLMWLLGRIETL